MKRYERRRQYILSTIMIIYSVLIVIPIIFLISASLTDETTLAFEGFQIIPSKVSLEAYEFLFERSGEVLRSMWFTFWISLVSTFWGIFVHFTAAYVLSKKSFVHRNKISFYFYFTCLFGGGATSSYIFVTRTLNIDDTIWIYILGGIGAFTIFVYRANIQKIPYELQESAYLDGANDYDILWRIITPLSKPVIAYYAFTSMVGGWNDYSTGMYYITRPELYKINYMLQRYFMNATLLRDMAAKGVAISEKIKQDPARKCRI